ncbi:MAG: RHS repeat-associated core domain-containing protein [Lachnospiraceae bacterium]|nr:RHS repeat-associated core domain-containing protein [Lachnospiraceae bacterium]
MSLLKNHRYRIILLQTLCTYDVCGNLTTDGSNTYSYDELNRVSQITTEDGHVQRNRYDAEGLRAELEEDGRLVQFIYNHKGEVITEEIGEAGLLRYIRGLGIVSSDSEQAKTYYHYVCDYAGSTSHVLNEQGEVENAYLYDAFGNITASSENVPNRFCYTGEQYDRIPNQYYLRARYYNPVIGRFTQQDTYLGAGLNLYAYCGGNPLSYVDPSGHDHLSATDNAGNNYGCIQTPEALQQPSVQRMIDNYARTINDSAQKATDAMIKAVYGDDGVSGAQVQSAGTLSDINNGPESTALMVIDPPNSLVPAIYKPINTGGDTNPSTALAPVAPLGSYEIVLYSDAGTNPLEIAQRSAVAEAVSDAGGESGRYSHTQNLDGLNEVRRHLTNDVDGLDFEPNKAMMNKIEEMLSANQELTGAYKDFYEHELTESMLMQQGHGYNEAHNMALEIHNVQPQALYSPEIVQEYSKWFNKNDFEYWGITKE